MAADSWAALLIEAKVELGCIELHPAWLEAHAHQGL
jgi:hypothetical protein